VLGACKTMRNADEGLGLSLLVYFGVMVAALAIFTVPIFWLNAPTVYPNAQLAAASAVPGGPLYEHRERREFPLAVLQMQPIVDAALLAQVNAKAEKPARTATRPARHYAQAPDADMAERPVRRSFFSFF
jgi:hypothetical protein